MSIFLERQQIRKRKTFAKRIKATERVLFSLAVVLGGVAAMYGLYLFVVSGPIFPVKKIVVDGNLTRIMKEEVETITGIGIGQKLFVVNVENAHERLKEYAWIREATVRRRLPNTIWIYVEEYEPEAIIINDNVPFYVDKEGVVFKKVEPGDPLEYKIISGVDSKDGSEQLKESLNLLFTYEESGFGKKFGISELHYDELIGYSIVTDNNPFQIVLGQDAFYDKIDFLSVCQGIVEHPGVGIKYILATSKERIAVGYHRDEI
ncbi:MAG: hypothetical protein COS89_03330 [Deltaproteobacteria bacterium CG07_land_8_20_14_0_80_38_7]|nr:MAG: hypothetical protein COS89_03330 [Deltaproteobacteria bacterium CG07_land_8_20_14_0_80_38_7]